MSKMVYLFEEGNADMRNLLGGKGALKVDKSSDSFQYIILLPGGLQVLSGLIDVQRGSYFGAIVFLG